MSTNLLGSLDINPDQAGFAVVVLIVQACLCLSPNSQSTLHWHRMSVLALMISKSFAIMTRWQEAVCRQQSPWLKWNNSGAQYFICPLMSLIGYIIYRCTFVKGAQCWWLDKKCPTYISYEITTVVGLLVWGLGFGKAATGASLKPNPWITGIMICLIIPSLFSAFVSNSIRWKKVDAVSKMTTTLVTTLLLITCGTMKPISISFIVLIGLIIWHCLIWASIITQRNRKEMFTNDEYVGDYYKEYFGLGEHDDEWYTSRLRNPYSQRGKVNKREGRQWHHRYKHDHNDPSKYDPYEAREYERRFGQKIPNAAGGVQKDDEPEPEPEEKSKGKKRNWLDELFIWALLLITGLLMFVDKVPSPQGKTYNLIANDSDQEQEMAQKDAKKPASQGGGGGNQINVVQSNVVKGTNTNLVMLISYILSVIAEIVMTFVFPATIQR